jgi:hypothetical protein
MAVDTLFLCFCKYCVCFNWLHMKQLSIDCM